MAIATRRTYRAYYASRGICFGPAIGLPAWGWDYLGRPLQLPGAGWAAAAGLGLMVLAGLLVIPALFVTLAAFAPDLPKLAVPRSWRASWRNRRPRSEQKSAYISDRLRRLVYAADRRRCTGCGAPGSDVDHRIPWSWGGLTVLWNCFTLCDYCNRVVKVDYWEDWRGRAHWGRHFNTALRAQAHQVFRRESGLRGRLNPLRVLRIAWALGT